MKYDVAVIGAGPGGYVAAIRMGQLGFKVVLVEEERLGGVCLNHGCVPTKALYAATKLLERAKSAREMGIEFSAPQIDLPRLASWKEGVVSRLAKGIAALLKSNGVTLIEARGRLNDEGKLALSTGEIITAKRIVLATGSSPMEIPGFSFKDSRIWSSNEALALTEIPKRLVVIGGGVIGLELATIYNRLGSTVTVIEMMPEILPGIDLDRRSLTLIKRLLKAQGIAIHLDTAAESYEKTKEGLVVHTKNGEQLEADRVLLVVGRRPNSSGIGLETVGIELDHCGFIPVDENLQTTVPGVYAIGDLVPGPMLAHKASHEGLLVAEPERRTKGPMLHPTSDTRSDATSWVIPQAIFTDPEVASVGLSEKRAKEEGYSTVVGRFPYAALGKAQGMGETEGFFQVVAEEKSGRLLGIQIVGAEASDLISEAVLAVHSGLTLSAIAQAVHPHPTLPEGLKEAAENALGRAIHAVNR